MQKKPRLFILAAAVAAAALCFLAGILVSSLYRSPTGYFSGGGKAAAESMTGGIYGYNGAAVQETAAAMSAKAAASTTTMDTAVSNDLGLEEDGYYEEAINATDTPLAGQELPASTDRKLIRTIGLSVETTEFNALLNEIKQAVDTCGGYIEHSDISGSSISDSQGRRYAYLTARIPAEKLDSFIAHVDEQGNVTNQSENIEDITLQYHDIESRRKSLSIEQDRLWELLKEAESVDAIIAVEQRLSDIRYQLESMESQLRSYDNRVDYSTVNIDITEVLALTPTTPDNFLTRIQKGFQGNLRAVGNTIINVTIWLVSGIPVLAALAILLIFAILLWKLLIPAFFHKKKAAAKPPEAKSPDPEKDSLQDKQD